MCRMVRINETLRLTKIHFFLQFAIKKCCLDIHLINGHIFTGGIGDEDSNSLDACNWSKGFLKVNSLLLSISRGHQPCLVFQNIAVLTKFNFYNHDTVWLSTGLYKHHKASVASCFLVDTGRDGLPMTLSIGWSYANIVNEASSGLHGSLISTSPALVLDDSCLVDRDLSKHVLGKVKDFSSIPNLYTLLSDEGFSDVKITYLGVTWVMFEFDTKDTKKNMIEHTRINSWFHVIQDAENNFVSDERIVWVDIEGVPINAWSRETFIRIGKKWGEMLDLEDNADNSFGRKHLCIKTKHERIYTSEDESEEESVHVAPHLNKEESDNDNSTNDEEVPDTVFRANSASKLQFNGEGDNQNSEDPFEIYDLLKKQKLGKNRKPNPLLSYPPGFSKKRNDIATDNEATDGNVDKESSTSFNAKVMNTSQEVLEVSHSEFVGQQSSIHNGGSALGVLDDIIKVGQSMGYTAEGYAKDLENIIEWIKALAYKHKLNYLAIQETKMNMVSHMDEASIFKKDNATISDNFVALYGTWLPTNSKIMFVVLYAPQQPLSKRVLWDYISVLLGRWVGDAIIMGDFNEVWSIDERHGSTFNPYIARRFDQFISTLGLVDVKLEGYTFTWPHPSASKMGLIDKDLDHGVITDDKMLRHLKMKRKLLDITEMEAKDNLQKSKLKWAVEGDENSKFFHGIINKRRSQLATRGIFVDGIWCTEPGMIKDAFLNHFEARFKEPDAHRFKLNFQFPKKLLHGQSDELERHVSRDEIRSAVWNCGDNKSPGPDGYTFEFFKKSWDLIGMDFCEAVELFFMNGSFSKGCNSSFVALIPKDFLIDVLEAFGFGPTWCNWIRGTFSFAKASILVNGSPSKEFSFHRGLKQGLQINIHKSQVLGVGVPHHVVEQAASTIGCSIMHNQFQYLGVKVGEFMSRHKAWEDTILKLISWLSKWKAKTLSIGGHLTLLKSILCASPIYSMSIFKVPRGVSNVMEAIRNRFFTGADTSDRKITWAAWDKDKGISVAIKFNSSLDQSFHRGVRGGVEFQQLMELQSKLDLISLSHSRDHWFCDLTGDGEFRVKEVRNFIDDLFLPSFDSTRWVKCIPIKINVFVWRARQDCLATRVNLARRGVSLESNIFPICHTCEEDIQHLLFQCDLAQIVLQRICRWWDLVSHIWTSFMEWQSWFSSVRFTSKVKDLLEGVFTLLGGLFGLLGIGSFFRRVTQDNWLSLMTLCFMLLIGVLVVVIGAFLGRIG
uniref:RNA-directed DNA polymerase, eukaryota n=1 Tax=Tanacetum cinerariifolium TaxID=118510 RepID=A0A699GTD2_TANCI|nr:RNA-directed DNA polymerase, eukaryota [Tanacetum cinerariifolium]